jgi:cytochrome o ubiquinol oxidase subunit 2
LPAEQFAQWMNGARSAGDTLDRGRYTALAQQSRNVEPFTFRAVEPGLFEAIATRQIPPGPGPTGGAGGATVRPSGGK